MICHPDIIAVCITSWSKKSK